MASNGYVRRVCDKCIFYKDAREYGYQCTLHGELFDSENMEWVSALDYERYPYMANKHDENCKHYSSEKEIKNQIREKFGIEKIDYKY